MAVGSPDETSFIAKHESGTGIFTQQRQLLQVGKAAQRTGSSAPSTQHFQVRRDEGNERDEEAELGKILLSLAPCSLLTGVGILQTWL